METADRPRRRDAAQSRERLLRAAGELFADRGYDQTTARDIGERAGVDPAMIARYFGGKAQLYIAVLHAESGVEPPSDFLDPERLAGLVARATRQGPGPIYQVAVRTYDDPKANDAALTELQRRIVAPVRERLEERGTDHAQLRAEVLTSALIGVFLSRRTGALAALAEAPEQELLVILKELLEGGANPSH